MRARTHLGATVSACLLLGCARATPRADPAFSDAVRFLLRTFEGQEADLAFGLRDLESQIHDDMDLRAKSANDRALRPALLEEADVVGMEHPDRDLARALPVAVAALSPFPLEDHPPIQMLTDHTPVEPYSPDHYVRTWREGRSCWPDGSCDIMRTTNDITKDNFLMTVDYVFEKDFRWIDMNLPDPSSVPEGEAPVNDGAARMAYLGRSWTTRSYAGRNDNAWIHQSFTIEIWVPAEDGRETLRMLCLWSETEFDGLSVSDEQVIATTRQGIDRNFEAQNRWLEDR